MDALPPSSQAALLQQVQASITTAVTSAVVASVDAALTAGLAQIQGVMEARVGAVEGRLQGVEQKQLDIERRLRDDIAQLREQMGIMSRAEPCAAPAGPDWDRPPDLAAVVLRSKEELPSDAFKQAIAPILADAGMGPDSFVVEAEPLGKRCVYRFKGPPELGARRAAKVLGCMRLGRGEWRKPRATTPAGHETDVFVGADQNRKQVLHELTLKKLAVALGRVVGGGHRIFVDKQKYVLSIQWKSFLRLAIEGPNSKPVVVWSPSALAAVGLRREDLEPTIEAALAPDDDDWCL